MKYKVEVLGKPVATLERTGVNKCVLTYESTAIENDFISLTMPVQTESWVWEKGLHPFFQMNLPEGYLLKILQERVGAFVNDPVFLLSLVGGNMIGRVKVQSLMNVDAKNGFKPHEFNLEEFLSVESSIDLFASLVEQHAASGVSGVVPKFLDEFKSQKKSTLFRRRHIIKGSTDHMPFAGLNEHLCMSVVEKVMPASKTYVSKDGRALAVDRFDLRDDGSLLYGLEDFCSLLGYDPSQKYDPTWERIAKAGRDHVRVENQREFFEGLTKLFFLYFCLRNGDCHSKNISLRYTTKEDVHLSPIYDILTTVVYKGYENNPPGLMYMGKKTWNPGTSIHRFLKETFFIPLKEQTQLLENICDAITSTIPQVEEAMENYPGFKEMGKQMLFAWNQGVSSMRDKKAYALPLWRSTEKIHQLSKPPKSKAAQTIIGSSEALGLRGNNKRLSA